MVKNKRQVKVQLNSNFKEFNQCKKRYRIAMGSAGSGKSVDIATDFILKLGDRRYEGANLVCVRKVNETNRDSTFAELKAAIFRIYGSDYEKYWSIRNVPIEMESKVTGNKILFRGMKDDSQVEKVKSITVDKGKITWIWLEEATEFTRHDVDIMDDRLRGDLSFNPNLFYQMTLSFNPVSALHWIKADFWDREDPDTYKHHSTYEQNRFIDEAYRRRMMRRKETDPEGYRVYGLGEWGETGGLILQNYKIEDFDRSHERFDHIVNAQDFGFNHANALLEIGFKDGDLFIMQELYLYEHDTDEIIQKAEGKFQKDTRMWCDSAEPDRIKMWKKAGYRAKGVKKEPGSVAAQIDYLKQHRIIIHPSCINTIKEIQQWKWKRDERTNTYLDEPVPFFDDAMAALRYSIEDERKIKPKLNRVSGGL